MNLRSRARQMFGREKHENAIRVARVDQAVLKDLRCRAPQLEEAIANPPTLPNGEPLNARVWEALAEDTFSAYYGSDEPSLHARDRIDPRFHVNREVDDKTVRSEPFHDRRAMTRGQRTASTMALLGSLDSLARSYADELGEHGESQNEIAAAEDELERIDDMLDQLRQDRNEVWGDPEAIDKQVRKLAGEKRETLAALRGAQHNQRNIAGDLIDAARKAALGAADAASEAVRVASLFPGKSPGAGAQVAPELMLAVMDRVAGNPELARILDLVGQMDVSMSNRRSKLRKGGYEEIVDIEMGNDLRNVLPMERALLTHPIARLDFFRRFAEQSLIQYDTWSEEELKRGPGIIAADGSDSMRGAPNYWARGLALATMTILNREQRNCAALEFGSAGELREFWFPGNRQLDTLVALDYCEHFYAGGTDINQVLARAKELIDNEAPFHSADLVVITDGGDRVTEQTIEVRDALRAMNVKIHGIVIGAQATEYVVTVCDTVSTVHDFAGPNSTSDRIAIDLT